jgi:hypothetical protein
MSATKLYAAGFRDLVSVIPPDAQLSPNTNVRPESRGKAPGKRSNGHWAGYAFTKDKVTPKTIESWGANVGLLGDHFPALDIDGENEKLNAVVTDLAMRVLGKAPVRTSRHPRKLLVYRTEEPFNRMALTLRHAGQEHTFEFLGQGRQYVIHGRHPAGVDYGWERMPLWNWSASDISVVTPAKVAEFFDALEQRLRSKGLTDIVRTGDGRTAEQQAPPQESLRAPNQGKLDALVLGLPNQYPDRESYITVGTAIKAAGGDLAVFQEWASRWEGGVNDPDVVEADWNRMHPPFRVGWSYLEDLRREWDDDYRVGSDAFEFEEMPPLEPRASRYREMTAALLSEPRPEQTWVWHGVLPCGGTSLMAAKPKVGKSTFSRALAVAVSRGDEFMGQPTTKGPVLYWALEGSEEEALEEFERLGSDGGVWFFHGQAGPTPVKDLYEDVVELRPSLVIVDTLQRFIQVKDLSDYASVTLALNPILELTRTFPDLHVLFLHHSPKGVPDDVADAALGSTALFGSVDTGIFMMRDVATGIRFYETRQRRHARGGDDIGRTVIEMDPITHWPHDGGNLETARVRLLAQQLAINVDLMGPMGREELLATLDARNQDAQAALKRAVDEGLLERRGAGRRGDPYTYHYPGADDGEG